MDIEFRAARKDDCLAIARLYRISSEGVADYIWTQLAEPGQDILHAGCQRYQREGTAFSYQNCIIVEVDQQVAGMMVAFPMHVDPSDQEEDPVLVPYSNLEEDNSYYICGIALFPEYRGRGIGSRLLSLAEQRAREKGFTRLSLVVFEENRDAKALYERIGYREVMREPIVPHPLIKMTGDAILMVKLTE